jgi:hypothetical protein
MCTNWSELNSQILKRTFSRYFLPSFGSVGQAVSEEKIFRNRPIRNKNCLWRICLQSNQDEMKNVYSGLSIDVSYQVSVHLAVRFQRSRFLEINQPETRMSCGSHFCKRIRTKWELSIEDLPKMLPTKFQFIWQSGYRGEDFFRNQSIRTKNCLWGPCLLMDQN